jgi:hypothetical protein
LAKIGEKTNKGEKVKAPHLEVLAASLVEDAAFCLGWFIATQSPLWETLLRRKMGVKTNKGEKVVG